VIVTFPATWKGYGSKPVNAKKLTDTKPMTHSTPTETDHDAAKKPLSSANLMSRLRRANCVQNETWSRLVRSLHMPGFRFEEHDGAKN
jgi:hypothetical protein